MRLTMKELLTEWRKETAKGNLTKKNKVISESGMEMNDADGAWYECMSTLQGMAIDNGMVCCLCASKAIEQCGQGPADMKTCLQLIQDCCDDGMLSPQRHLELDNVMIYVAID